MTPRLELRNLHKSFGATSAVRGLSLALNPGEFVSLLGPSGCGKSTTLAMIAGFEAPDAGEIVFNGVAVNRLPPQRRRIGLVFQDYAVFSRMTVRGNLAFALQGRRIRSGQRRQRVEEMAERLGLAGVLDRSGDRLTMSEMQRVALGRAFLGEPELLLLDEPMSNLDADLRGMLRAELKHIQRELRQTVLYVTHDQLEAMSLSDRIAVMHAGEILQFGTRDKIYDRPVDRFVAEFIGDPPINILACEVVVERGATTAATALHRGLRLGPADIPPGRHLLAVRPHDVAVSRLPGTASAPAAVRFVEELGAESVLHFDYGAEMLRAIAAPDFAAEGAILHITLPPHRLHLIERDSGMVVRSPAAEQAA